MGPSVAREMAAGESPPVAPAAQFPPELKATGLQATDVQATLESSIVPGRNYLYSATMQLAWDEFRDPAAWLADVS